ncbi:nucleotidyltransferase domain-containing protein [bacterium]|nr:nucleotidyltransferase domain-containing protein [bacterium]
MFKFEKYQDEINRICEKYHVKSLIVFGSALSNDFNESSDIDFLIEFDNAVNGINRYMNVKFELEKLFTRAVDLVMPKAIKNERIRNYIYSNIREIYAA